MEENYVKRLFSLAVLIILFVLCFLIVRPILTAIIFGLLLAFIFNSLYKKILKKTKNQNFSALIICFGLLALIVLPLWFLLPIAVDSAVNTYFALRDFDFVTPIGNLLSSISISPSFAEGIGNTIKFLITDFSDKIVRGISSLILEIPYFSLQIFVVFFTLFFTLRDKEGLFRFIESFSPFSPEIDKKLSKFSSEITVTILYGQIIIGAIQGLIVAASFFIFGVPYALLFSILAIVAGILPVIGTGLIWVPIFIYALANMSLGSAIGLLIFGLISTNLDNFLRPLIIAKKVKIHSSIILIGMIGGAFYFGILGFILGPLILAYLLIILEGYQLKRKKTKFVIEDKTQDFSLIDLIR